MSNPLSQPGAHVFLPFGWFANVDKTALEAVMLRLAHGVVPVQDGLVLSTPSHRSSFKVSRLCDASDMPALSERWETIFGRSKRLTLSETTLAGLRETAQQNIAERNFRWFAWRMLGLGEYDDDLEADVFNVALPIHRDALFPAFFNAYPGGRVLAITHEHQADVDGYLSVVNVLTRARRLGFDLNALLASTDRNAMRAIGLHHPIYFIWYSLFLAFAVFFPDLHGFAASLRHQAFLVYLLPKSERFDEIDPGLFEQSMPGLTMATNEGFTTAAGDVRFRKHRLNNGRAYSVDSTESYVGEVVSNAEQLMQRFFDLTRYPDSIDTGLDDHGNSIPLVDLGFAHNTLLTLFVLLRRTVTNTFKSDTFERTMTFYDLVDLHASLITTDPAKSAAEFTRLVHRSYALGPLAQKLRLYTGLQGSDLIRGLHLLRSTASKAVKGGILDGLSGANVTVSKRSKTGLVTTTTASLDDFEAKLLRALRNTKHGYDTRDADLLAMHTGDVDEDFPDYALALMLGLLADSGEYVLGR